MGLFRWSCRPAASRWSHNCFTTIPKLMKVAKRSACGAGACLTFSSNAFSSFSGLPNMFRRSWMMPGTALGKTRLLRTFSSASPSRASTSRVRFSMLEKPHAAVVCSKQLMNSGQTSGSPLNFGKACDTTFRAAICSRVMRVVLPNDPPPFLTPPFADLTESLSSPESS
uniref:(northern house mosquito) hypothetical protein n=1 Tax=Culex pipiens TaxID=7175 RepID=A0A8D8BG98_CULPI